MYCRASATDAITSSCRIVVTPVSKPCRIAFEARFSGCATRRPRRVWMSSSFGGLKSKSSVALSLAVGQRSEEHTSELQSLMRISYAVFCLTKKNHNNKQTKHIAKQYKNNEA